MHPIVGPDSLLLRYRGERRYAPITEEATTDYEVRRVLAPTLVRIEVSTGHVLRMTAETAFGLFKRDGAPLIYNPLHAAGAIPEIVPPAWSDPPGADFILDWRSWVLRGRLLARGTYSATRSRPARISYDDTESEAYESAVDFLYNARSTFDFRSKLAPVNISAYRDGRTLTICSRMLDWLAEGFLTPTDMGFAVPDCLERIGPMAAHGLATGILAASYGIFNHRDARVVKAVQDFLFYRYGLTGYLGIHPIEPDVQLFGKRIRNPHHFAIDHPELFQDAHKRERDPRRVVAATVKHVTLEPAGEAFELRPLTSTATFFAVNGFLLESRITVPDGAVDLATDLAAGGGEHTNLLDPIYEG